MSTNVNDFQRIREQYATWHHVLFWLGIAVNFLVFYLVISDLSYVGWAMPVIQGLYLAMCFKAYAKGSNALMIIIPLYVVSGALYMSLSAVT
jgi:hypothetical protein